ncbi:MAG TPA: SusD/RagB family nutrient-binding outer membrane lipoprotein, partial [Chitinophagaceae bacterium]|nr:SusD/RagB family nutrient-binding outer membrane lipoprotein [Chitinophagaceae bacterium]
MKKIFFLKNSLALVLLLGLFGSCTKDFEDLNTDKTKIAKLDNASLDYVFSAAQYRGVFGPNSSTTGAGPFQLFEALFADLQAQYFATTQKNFASDRNTMVGNWINGAWNHFYGNANAQLNVVLEQTKAGGELEDPIKNAIANVWKVYMFMPVTDYWGPVPYSQAGNGNREVLYDSQEEIYNDFFKSLRDASAVLNGYTGTGRFFEKGDLIYGGDTKKWLKLANSLRLRAAIRVSKKNPALAKTEAEAAVANPGGMITANADNAFMKSSPTTPHPLASISDWNEFRMSAAMESVLKGYSDPRMQKYFNPNASGQYKGIRNGLSQTQMDAAQNSNANNSNLNTSISYANRTNAPWGVFYAAETWFLLAEAKLNGWNVGAPTARSFYEGGIDASMTQWGVADAAAIAAYKASLSTPIPLGDIYNTPALSNIPVAFGATEAVQRE